MEINIRDNEILVLKSQLAEFDQTIAQLCSTIDSYANDQLRLISQHEKDRLEIERLRKIIDEMTEYKELADEIIRKQTAIIEKDYTNSSIPSSQNPNHKTIHNGRKPSKKKKGAQKGQKGHKRPDYKADEIVDLQISECVEKNPENYELLDQKKSRKVVSIHMTVYVRNTAPACGKTRKQAELSAVSFLTTA